MYLRQHYKSPSVPTPTYVVVPARQRLTIDVRNATALSLVPETIRRAAAESTYDGSMDVVINCQRCVPPPSVIELRILAETLADSGEVAGPVAVLVPGVPVAALRYNLDHTLSPWVACQLQVFGDAESMESWLAQSETVV